MMSLSQSQRFLLVLTILALWGHLGFGVFALKCYVCTDCENYYNDTHIIDCEETEERCLTLILANGETERACGSRESCTRSEAPPAKPAKVKKREEFLSNPKKRAARGLLEQKPLEKVETKEVPEFESMHCCKEDECNSAISISNVVKIPTLILLNALSLKIFFHQHCTFCLLLFIGIFYFTDL